MEQGCTEEDMELFEEIADEFSDSPKKAKERIDSLSETARQQVQEMMALYVRLYNDAAVDKAEINEWREVSLQKVEERDIELKESSAEYRSQLGLKRALQTGSSSDEGLRRFLDPKIGPF